MNNKPDKVWKDPQPDVKMVHKKVIRKSKAGVEYVHYVPTLEGTLPTGQNRVARRRQAAFIRSALYRRMEAKETRRREKKAADTDKSLVDAVKEKFSK